MTLKVRFRHFLSTSLKFSGSQIKKQIFLEPIFEQKSSPSWPLFSKLRCTDVMLASIAVCCGIRNHTGLLIMVERQSHFGCTNCVVLGPSCDFFLFFLWCIADILIWTWPQWVTNIFSDKETTYFMRTKVGLNST